MTELKERSLYLICQNSFKQKLSFVTMIPENAASVEVVEDRETCQAQNLESLANCVKSLGLAQIQRHIFICADPTFPQCCSKEASLASWEYLKKRLKQLKLDKPTDIRPSCIFRTKANCLRVCSSGPILVIYPDGVWYRQATPEVIERIIQEHLINNRVVEEYAFLTHPLPQPVTFDTPIGK